MKNYYEVLDAAVTSSPEDLKRAFRRRAKELHPDVNPTAGDTVEAMQRLLRAYETLIDPVRREEYDRRMLVMRPELRFDYREFLRSRPEDYEFQSRLVFYDLLHHREDEAVALFDKLRSREAYRLERCLDREDFMDCAFLLAEEYERRGRYLPAFHLLVDVIRAEHEQPYFRHFVVEVTDALRTLVCFRMPSVHPGEVVIECINSLMHLPLPQKDRAFYMKKAAELYADLGDSTMAGAYLQRGLELDGKLQGTKKLRDRLASLQV